MIVKATMEVEPFSMGDVEVMRVTLSDSVNSVSYCEDIAIIKAMAIVGEDDDLVEVAFRLCYRMAKRMLDQAAKESTVAQQGKRRHN